jgi:hypothetical protein
MRHAWCTAFLLLACGPAIDGSIDDDADPHDSPTSGSPTTDPSMPTSATNGPDSGTSGGSGAPSGYEDDDGGTGCTFTCPDPPNPPGGGGWWSQCDLLEQDCPDGQKCSPWDHTGSGTFSATRCTPLDPNAQQPGEPCQSEGSGFSGVDTCAAGSICFNVDAELQGTCVQLCEGLGSQAGCEQEGTWCHLFDIAPLCLTRCNPLLDDCGRGLGCYPHGADFVCLLAGQAVVPSECQFVNDCSPGMFCAHASLSPGCEHDRCCAQLCDASDSIEECLAPGTTCSPFPNPPPSPSWDNVGLCSD